MERRRSSPRALYRDILKMVFDELAYAQSCADKARFPLKKPAGVCTLAGPNYRLLFVCAGPLRVATGTMGYKHEIDTLIGTLDYGFVPQKPRISQTKADSDYIEA